MSSDACSKTETDLEMEDLENLLDKECIVEYHAGYDNKISENWMKRFTDISDTLGKVLPKLNKDSDIFEIDDLLYEDDNKNDANMQSLHSEETNITFSDDCFALFQRIYTEAELFCSHWKTNRKLDETFLQIIKETEDKSFKKFYFVISHVTSLISSRNTKKLCFALKLLRIVLEKDVEAVIKHFQDYSRVYYSYMFISNLCKIPQARLPKQKRISNWLRNQSNAIFTIIHSKPFETQEIVQDYFDVYQTEKSSRPDELRFLSCMKFVGTSSRSFICEHLHTFFMSAKDENEKIKRLKDFLIAISCGKHIDLEDIEEIESNSTAEDFFDECSTHSVMYFKFFRDILKNRMYADDVLRDMEKKLGCEIKPYLSRQDATVEDVIKFEECNDSSDSDDEADYTIEKYIFFDDFVKDLEVMDAIYTACMMCKQLFDTEDDVVGLDTCYFRGFSSALCQHIRMVLLNPSKRTGTPWIIEILLKQCPFMFFSKEFEYLAPDLIKILNGEEIDELTEEKILFATHCMHFDGREEL